MREEHPLSSQAIIKPAPHEGHNHVVRQSLWDRIGVAGSALCMVHCISTPLLLGYLSTIGLGFFAHELFHQVFAVALLAVAIFAFLPGYRAHKRKGIILAAGVGVTLLIAGGFLHFESLPSFAEHILTVIGSVLLVSAHFFNRRCQSTCHA